MCLRARHVTDQRIFAARDPYSMFTDLSTIDEQALQTVVSFVVPIYSLHMGRVSFQRPKPLGL